MVAITLIALVGIVTVLGCISIYKQTKDWYGIVYNILCYIFYCINTYINIMGIPNR